MSSWTKTDAAGGAPLWAVTMLNKAPTASNRTSLYENASAGTFITGATHGLFNYTTCLLYTSPSPRDKRQSRMPSSA